MKVIQDDPNCVVPDFRESDFARHNFLVHIKKFPNEYIGIIYQEPDSTFRIIGENCNSCSCLVWFDDDNSPYNNRTYNFNQSLLGFIQYSWNKYILHGYGVTVFIVESELDASNLITQYGIENSDMISRLTTV